MLAVVNRHAGCPPDHWLAAELYRTFMLGCGFSRSSVFGVRIVLFRLPALMDSQDLPSTSRRGAGILLAWRNRTVYTQSVRASAGLALANRDDGVTSCSPA